MTAAVEVSLSLDLVEQATTDGVCGLRKVASLAAVLRYDPSEPFEVALVIDRGRDFVTWRFARELLADGLNGPSGDGQVHVVPSLPSLPVLFLRLAADGGGDTAVFRLRRGPVARFLRDSYVLVPRGRESDHVGDWDAALAALTGGAK